MKVIPMSDIARQNVLIEDSLNALDTALERFHNYCEVFQMDGVHPDGFSLPANMPSNTTIEISQTLVHQMGYACR